MVGIKNKISNLEQSTILCRPYTKHYSHPCEITIHVPKIGAKVILWCIQDYQYQSIRMIKQTNNLGIVIFWEDSFIYFYSTCRLAGSSSSYHDVLIHFLWAIYFEEPMSFMIWSMNYILSLPLPLLPSSTPSIILFGRPSSLSRRPILDWPSFFVTTSTRMLIFLLLCVESIWGF